MIKKKKKKELKKQEPYMAQMNPSANHRQTHRHKEQTRGCQGGGMWGGLGVWD